MSIKESTYKITKNIQSIPEVSKVKELIQNLSLKDVFDPTKLYRKEMLGDVARKMGFQFMGYLDVDAKIRKTWNNGNGLFSDDEKSLLSKANNTIIDINLKLIDVLNVILPDVWEIISPYRNIPVYEYTRDKFTIDEDLLKQLANDFLGHPSIKSIIKHSQMLKLDKRYVDVAYIKNNVQKIVDIINNSNIFELSKEINEMRESKKYDEKHRWLNSIIFSMASLSISLSVFNQLLFQAFFIDKLACLNETNIYHIDKYIKFGIGGESARLNIMYNEDFKSAETKDVVYVDIQPINNKNIEDIFFLYDHTFSFTVGTGWTHIVSLRYIDDNLNYYSSLHYLTQ